MGLWARLGFFRCFVQLLLGCFSGHFWSWNRSFWGRIGYQDETWNCIIEHVGIGNMLCQSYCRRGGLWFEAIHTHLSVGIQAAGRFLEDYFGVIWGLSILCRHRCHLVESSFLTRKPIMPVLKNDSLRCPTYRQYWACPGLADAWSAGSSSSGAPWFYFGVLWGRHSAQYISDQAYFW